VPFFSQIFIVLTNQSKALLISLSVNKRIKASSLPSRISKNLSKITKNFKHKKENFCILRYYVLLSLKIKIQVIKFIIKKREIFFIEFFPS
jgi:hypothetical protein